MTNFSEPGHKIAAKIANAKLRHMSDAKWRKLFALLHDLPGGYERIGVKLVGSTVIGVALPGPIFEAADHFGSSGALAGIPFSHIEFVGISNSRASNGELISFFSQFGQWPVEEEDEGILIKGYEWE